MTAEVATPVFREPGPRAQRRIERMRVQPVGYAQRTRYDVSGTPREARPSIWHRLAMQPEPVR